MLPGSSIDRKLPFPGLPSADDSRGHTCGEDALGSRRRFPFGTEAHKAAWVASVLTPLARYAFHGPSPLYLFDANVRGCGKSLLTDATSTIISGRPMARMSLPHDDDETRKRITALAVAGEPLILIDNLPSGGFGSPSLDAALTATHGLIGFSADGDGHGRAALRDVVRHRQ